MPMDAQTRFRTQIVGALPAVVHYFDELDLAATIDRLVPWEGDVPLGTLAEVLVANRLLQPKALFRVGPWAQSAALTDYYGLTAGQLNDDRLGRALERLATHADAIQAALVVRAVRRSGGSAVRAGRVAGPLRHHGRGVVRGLRPGDAAGGAGPAPPTPRPAYGR